jgi:hypothetical protein
MDEARTRLYQEEPLKDAPRMQQWQLSLRKERTTVNGIRGQRRRQELRLGSMKTLNEALRQTLKLEVVKRTVRISIGLWEVTGHCWGGGGVGHLRIEDTTKCSLRARDIGVMTTLKTSAHTEQRKMEINLDQLAPYVGTGQVKWPCGSRWRVNTGKKTATGMVRPITEVTSTGLRREVVVHLWAM